MASTKKIIGTIASVVIGFVFVISAVAIAFGFQGQRNFGGTQIAALHSMDVMVEDSWGGANFRAQYAPMMAEPERRIITSNWLTIETRNVGRTVTAIEELVDRHDGQITHQNVDLGDRQWGRIVARVPSAYGAAFVNEINARFDVSAFNTDMADVTDRYVNTEREIENLRRQIALFQELEGQTPIREIDARIRIVNQIFELENRIEWLERMNEDIDERVEFREVSINLQAPRRVQGERNYWHNTAQMVIEVLQGSFRVVVVLVPLVLPFFVLIGIPLIIIHKRKRK